jgi:anti-anti-sigma factor
MKISESRVEDVPIIAIEGELDQSSKQVALDAVGDILSGAFPAKSLLFDLTACTFVDSGGLSVLLSALGQLPDDGWLGIIGASAGPNRVLEYTGFLELEKVRFFRTLGDAEWALAREAIRRGSGGRKDTRSRKDSSL